MLEHRLFSVGDARGYTPSTSEQDVEGIHGALALASAGPWEWKPYRYDSAQRYRFMVTGPRCTCTLSQPVGTSCARHTN
jgi:hypothetical protein